MANENKPGLFDAVLLKLFFVMASILCGAFWLDILNGGREPDAFVGLILTTTCISVVLIQELKRFFRWPRGRYNGKRIDGFQVSFSIHLLWWTWRPIISLNHGEPCFLWLFFSLRFYASYHD